LSDEIERYGALGFYHLAEDFHRAAVRSAGLNETKPRLHYDLVLYHLHTHSIELALKAYLRAKGIDVKDLKRKFSHGMVDLMAEATRLKAEGTEAEAVVPNYRTPRPTREYADVPLL